MCETMFAHRLADCRFGCKIATTGQKRNQDIMTEIAARPRARRVIHDWQYVLLFHVVAWCIYGAVYYAEVVGSQKPADYWQVVVAATISGSAVSAIMAVVYSRAQSRSLVTKVAIALVTSLAMAVAWSLIRHTFYDDWYAPEQQSRVPISVASVIHGMNALLFWSALYFVYVEYNIAKFHEFQRLLAQSLAQETQLKLLSYQLNPHFFFNTLNSIATLVLKNDTQAAHSTILKLSDFLRYTIESKPWKKVTLRQEIQCISQYLDIQKVRFQERLQVYSEIPNKILDAKIPNLLLQPIVENAIKHTVGTSAGCVQIRIRATKVDRILQVEVTNSLDAYPTNEYTSAGDGHGLFNVRERLVAYYGDKASLDAGHVSDSFSVALSIPFELTDTSQ